MTRNDSREVVGFVAGLGFVVALLMVLEGNETGMFCGLFILMGGVLFGFIRFALIKAGIH